MPTYASHDELPPNVRAALLPARDPRPGNELVVAPEYKGLIDLFRDNVLQFAAAAPGHGQAGALPPPISEPQAEPPLEAAAPPRVRPTALVPLNFSQWPPPSETLFLFHDTTGSVHHFHRLNPHLWHPCCAVQLSADVPLSTFMDMVAYYTEILIEALPLPGSGAGGVRLGGFSFGARSSFHVARALHRRGYQIAAFVAIEDPPAFDLSYISAEAMQRGMAMAANLFAAGTQGRRVLAEQLTHQRPTSVASVNRDLMSLVLKQDADDRSPLLQILLRMAQDGQGAGMAVVTSTLRIISAMSQNSFWQGYSQVEPEYRAAGVPPRKNPRLICEQALLCRSTPEKRAVFQSLSEHKLTDLPHDYGMGASLCTLEFDVVLLPYHHQDMFSAACGKLLAQAIDKKLMSVDGKEDEGDMTEEENGDGEEKM